VAVEKGEGRRVLSIGKAALVAGIALGLVTLPSIAVQLGGSIHTLDRWWQIFIPFNVLILALPPTLLLLLYRSGTTLIVSKAMRRLAVAAALLQGVVLVSGIYSEWFRTSNSFDRLWGTPLLASQAAFMPFLVALFWHRNEVGDKEAGRSYWLREVAALTAIMSGLALIWRIGQQAYVSANLLRHGLAWFGVAPSAGQFIGSYTLTVLQEVCWMLAAYIVYRSAPAQPASAAE
jgi:hypothetical protein